MEKIRLQGEGMVDAILAKDIKVGDILCWNYGYTSTVQQIVKETPKQIVIKTLSDDGFLHERRLGKSRLVGIKKRNNQYEHL